MGNHSPVCSKKQNRSKTPPPPTTNLGASTFNSKIKQSPNRSKTPTNISAPKSLPKFEKYDYNLNDEMQKSIGFLSNYMHIRDVVEISPEILTKNCLMTYDNEENAKMQGFINFDALFGEKSKKKQNSQRIAHEVYLEQESVKSLQFISRNEESSIIEKTGKQESKRNSKGKSCKNQRNSLKSIKENSSLFSNKFETDNEESEIENKENKKGRKSGRKEENTSKNWNSEENIRENGKNGREKEKHDELKEKPHFSENSLVREFDLEDHSIKGYQSKGDNRSPLMNLGYSKITYVEADQTQSAFGRMSFGSEHFNTYLVEEKSPNFDKEKEGFNDENNERQKTKPETIESETESKRKEESMQNSKLKDQILKILGQMENGNSKQVKDGLQTLIPQVNLRMHDIPVKEQIPERPNTEEGTSISLNVSKKSSKPERKKNLSIKSINKSSFNKSGSQYINPITTPKQKQMTVQNHYLNKNKGNSYSKIMKQKKQENTQSYNKLVNSSNIDLKIERSALGNNSIIISPIGKRINQNKNEQNESKIRAYFNQNSKDSTRKTPSNSGYKGNFFKRDLESKNETIPVSFQINLDLKSMKKSDSNNNNQKVLKENVNSENFLERFPNNIENIESEECEESGDELSISKVKEDILNLRNKMTLPEKYTKHNVQNIQEKTETTTEASSLRERINKVLSKKTLATTTENGEVHLENVIDSLPNYEDPVSYEEEYEEEDSDKVEDSS